MSSERNRRCSCSCGGASSISVTVFTVSSSSLPEICSYSRTTFCHSDSLSMYSASEPALFRRGCVGSLQQCHLPASVRGPVLSIKFSECWSSVTAFRFHDQAQKSVLDAAHDDRVQHEIGFLSLFVWRKIGQQVCGSSAAGYATSWKRHWSYLPSSVQSMHDGRLRCRGSMIIKILQIRARIVSLLHNHTRMRHQRGEHFARPRKNVQGIKSLMNHQADCTCNSQDENGNELRRRHGKR